MQTQAEIKSIPLLCEQKETRRSAVVAGAFIGTAAAPVAIGFFHVLAETFPAAKSFLTLHDGIGPYSGKVLFGYLAGFAVTAVFSFFGWAARESPWRWLCVMLSGLALGTLMVFAPVTHWLVEMLK